MTMKTSTLIRAEEFALVAHVLGPCELVKGEIVPMSPGGVRHSKVTGRAYFLLETHNRSRQLGHVLTGEAGIIVARGPDTVRGADVAFISYQRLPKDATGTGFLQSPPELIVEVFSDDVSWKAIEEKIAEYHHFGVDLVWILEPRTSTLHAYGRGVPPVVLRETDTVSAEPYMPGFACRVAEFFESSSLRAVPA
jgi:Uma2 family endonuclease